MILGEIIIKNEEIQCNKGKKVLKITVFNDSERPVQVGSHFHFFEVNRALAFDRRKTFGMRLNIPAGTGLRFEPGEKKEIQLVEIGGEKIGYGLNGLTSGSFNDEKIKEEALQKAKEKNFIKGEEDHES
ncbi:urease subunit beta [Clostridium formicaceticum]|uniref:Urease subunit beta n=1 Tax=Clostridium formicaceticum TaxID=1497 RepID=A0AAC9RM70_9CLOT|nr:urease subunit beta [Clostridium formicaceticum]ARE86840.1 Urease subunit beta [Clostridium formicaceticum]